MKAPSYLDHFLYGGMNFNLCNFSVERDVSILFSVEFVMPSSETIETMMARFKNDLGLKLSIALYYGVTVKHIHPMIHVDEEDDDAGIYLMVNGFRSINMIDMISSQIGIFETMTANLNIVETRTRIATYTHRNYSDIDNGYPTTKTGYSISTKICAMQDRGPFPSFKVSPFGIEITVGYVNPKTIENLNVGSIVGDPNLIRIVIDECRSIDEWFFNIAFPEIRIDANRESSYYAHTSTDFIFLGQAKDGDPGTCSIRVVKRLDTYMGWHIHYAAWNRMIIAPADIYDKGKRMVTISPSNIMNINRGILSTKQSHDEGVAGQMVHSMELLHANLFQSPHAFVYAHVTNWAIEKVDGMEYYDVFFRNVGVPWAMTEMLPKIEGLEFDPRYNPKAIIFKKAGLDLQMLFPIEPVNPIPGAIAYGRFNAALGSITELYEFCSSRDDVYVKILSGYDQWVIFAVMCRTLEKIQAIRPQTPVRAFDATRGHYFELFRTDYLMELHNDLFRGHHPGTTMRTLDEVFQSIIAMVTESDTSEYLHATQEFSPDEVVLRLLSLYVRTVGIMNDPYLDATFTQVVREKFKGYIASVEGGSNEEVRDHHDTDRQRDPFKEALQEIRERRVLHVEPDESETEDEDETSAPPPQVSLSADQIRKNGIRPDVMKAIHSLATATMSNAPDLSDIKVIDYTDDEIDAEDSQVPLFQPSPLFGNAHTPIYKHRGLYQKFWIDFVTKSSRNVPKIEADVPFGEGKSYMEKWEAFRARHAAYFIPRSGRASRVPMKVLRAIGFVAGYWPDGKWRIRDTDIWDQIAPSFRNEIRKLLKQAFYCDVRDGIVTDPDISPSFIMYTHPNLFGSPKEPVWDKEGLELTRKWVRFRVTSGGLVSIEAATKYAYFLRPEVRERFIDDTVKELERTGFRKNQICCENALKP